jgi:hypothetical protein
LEIQLNEVIFESRNGNESTDLMEQFLSSGYLENNTLMMDRFLDGDKTIDLEKLEVAIMLTIEHLENSIKVPEPIYINLGNMESYFFARNVPPSDLEQILEESSFILGFCSSIAEEYEIDHKVNVQFKGKEL